MSFGGNYAFAGAENNYVNGIMEKGYTAHCGGCKILGKCDHGEVKGSLAELGLGGDMGLHRSHMGPKHNSNSHLRYSTEWIKEAYAPTEEEFQDSTLKIMVAYALENEAMCEQLYYSNKGNGGAGGDGYPCNRGDSWPSLKRQLDAIKAWALANDDWMQVAYTATQAREIVNANKLAIILGIESEYSFGAESSTFDPVDRLNQYYQEGVRTFYLAHKMNSRLSGADIFLPKNSLGGRAIRLNQAISGCFYYDDNIGQFPLKGRLGKNLCDNQCGDNAFKGGRKKDKCIFKLSEITDKNSADYLSRAARAFNGFKLYPRPPGFIKPGDAGGSTETNNIERNNLGLSHDGERVVREAMLRGMIINIDHVSSRSRMHIHDIATSVFNNYPLNALHNKPNERLVNRKKFKRHEYDFDRAELDFIRESGGIFGFRMGPTDSIEYPESGISAEFDCPKTSTESAKMLAWLIDQGLNVGYSLDYATITQGVFSRTYVGCGMGISDSADQLHTYGRHKTEGLAHIGMMKKWHKELEAIGLNQRYLDTLKNDGVEAFLRMWEISESRASSGSQIPRQIFQPNLLTTRCREDSNCATNQFCSRMGADIRNNRCTAKRQNGSVCTSLRQCQSGRCSLGFCADADECQSNSDCASGQYCGNPISGRRLCRDLRGLGSACTFAAQCASSRCSWGFCADPNECRINADCASNEFCGDPISGRRLCKRLLTNGQACTKALQCSSGRCSWSICADADECR
ncbi:MAG TPA: hypothetical protein ENJ41_06295, partial [Oceanospirillales bacterium]|nr:hypothetical protein [Oceanospirillales bacterium]